MHERSALQSREDRGVDGLLELFSAEDQSASRAAQCLVRCRCYDVSIRYRILMQTDGNQTCDVSHVDHEQRADFIRDLLECLEIDGSRIRGSAGYDQLRLMLLRLFADIVVVDALVLAQSIGYEVVGFTGDVDRGSVGQVSAVGQVHAQNGIAVVQDRLINSCVGVGAGVGLYVRVVRAEELACSVDCQLLYFIDEFASAVVSLARISFGILVGQRASRRFHDLVVDEVL